MTSISHSNDTLPTDNLNTLRFNDELMMPTNIFLMPPMPRMDLNNNGPL